MFIVSVISHATLICLKARNNNSYIFACVLIAHAFKPYTHTCRYFLNKQSYSYMYSNHTHSVKNKIGDLQGLLQSLRVCILIPVHLTVIMTILSINSTIFCCMEDTQSL